MLLNHTVYYNLFSQNVGVYLFELICDVTL